MTRYSILILLLVGRQTPTSYDRRRGTHMILLLVLFLVCAGSKINHMSTFLFLIEFNTISGL